jgi:hypothetical protein
MMLDGIIISHCQQNGKAFFDNFENYFAVRCNGIQSLIEKTTNNR